MTHTYEEAFSKRFQWKLPLHNTSSSSIQLQLFQCQACPSDLLNFYPHHQGQYYHQMNHQNHHHLSHNQYHCASAVFLCFMFVMIKQVHHWLLTIITSLHKDKTVYCFWTWSNLFVFPANTSITAYNIPTYMFLFLVCQTTASSSPTVST